MLASAMLDRGNAARWTYRMELARTNNQGGRRDRYCDPLAVVLSDNKTGPLNCSTHGCLFL
jgi:hypothetical protein